MGTVDFGASTMPLTLDGLDHANLTQFAIVIGGVVPVVNIEGVKPGTLHFTGSLLAEIYLGKITRFRQCRTRDPFAVIGR